MKRIADDYRVLDVFIDRDGADQVADSSGLDVEQPPVVGVRKPRTPELLDSLNSLIEPGTRGDPDAVAVDNEIDSSPRPRANRDGTRDQPLRRRQDRGLDRVECFRGTCSVTASITPSETVLDVDALLVVVEPQAPTSSSIF